MMLMNSLWAGILQPSVCKWYLSNLKKPGLILYINQCQSILGTELRRTHLGQYIHYNQNHLKLIWKKCLNRICTSLDLRQRLYQPSQMMKAENLSFHSTVAMIRFKFMKFVTKIQAELVANLWKRRSIRTLLHSSIMKKKISWLVELFSWEGLSFYSKKLMNIQTNTWKIIQISSQSRISLLFFQKLRKVLVLIITCKNTLLNLLED